MLRLILTFSVLAASMQISQAIAQEEMTDAEKLAASRDTWDDLKQKCVGNYRYFVRTSSFTGFGTETEIVVRRNKVAGRRFLVSGGIERVLPEGEPEAPQHKWVEKGEEVGKNKEGAPPKTLDELYDEAEKVIAHELAEHEKLYLRFDKQGLLTSCFYVDTRIADDAPTTGVTISAIKLEGEKKQE